MQIDMKIKFIKFLAMLESIKTKTSWEHCDDISPYGYYTPTSNKTRERDFSLNNQ